MKLKICCVPRRAFHLFLLNWTVVQSFPGFLLARPLSSGFQIKGMNNVGKRNR